MVRFYIIRHGQTLLNSLDWAQGWTDLPLTEAGKQMAADIGYKLSGIDFDAAYTIWQGNTGVPPSLRAWRG